MKLEEFNQNLLGTKDKTDRLDFAKKYFFHGIPFVFDKKEDQYFEFRNRIAKNFKINFGEVFIVGSGKLGFSYMKEKIFSLESDIDVAIVSENLFEKYHLAICEYQYSGIVEKLDETEHDKYVEFLKYLAKGWMRPDLLPSSLRIQILKKEWFDYFSSLSNGKSEVGNYQVTAGLYKNYKYLEKYYSEQMEKHYDMLIAKKYAKTN